MHTTKLHFIFLLLCFFTFVNAQSQDSSYRNRSRTTKPAKDTSKSNFLNTLLGNIAASQKKRDSLDRYYRAHPEKVNTYVQTQLVQNRVVPNNDAIELIKAMNPRIRNLSEVNFYTDLRMPHFQKLKRPDSRRLRKERRSLLKYDSKMQNQFVSKLDACQNNLTKIQTLKLQPSGNASPAVFDNYLDSTIRQLQHYRTQNLKKGTSMFLMQQVDLLTSIVNDVISKRRTEKGHIDAMQKMYRAVSFSKSLYNINNNEVSYDDKQVLQKTSSFLWTSGAGPSSFYDLTSSGAEENVLCYIYAKKATAAGKEVDINGQYFYSYQPFGNATYNCRTGTCIGFNEGGRTVSVNGANIVPADYVFCFRDRTTSRVYYRCVEKDKFELVANSGTAGSKKKWRIVFNPESNECKDFLNW